MARILTLVLFVIQASMLLSVSCISIVFVLSLCVLQTTNPGSYVRGLCVGAWVGSIYFVQTSPPCAEQHQGS